MCGIICYFGGAGNGLTRLLTAMSAIIYRAPDSTGIGLFGDEQEPVRLRKSLGSVSQMVSALLGAAAYPDQSAKLMKLWRLPEEPVSLAPYQQRLLKFQEHPFIESDAESAGSPLPPTIDELIAIEGDAVFLKPGTPGRPDPLPVFSLNSEADVQRLIRKAATQYDISTVVIRSLIQSALASYVRESDESEEKMTEILNTFERIFDEILSGDDSIQNALVSESAQDQNPFMEDPEVRKQVWRCLERISIQIPDDYDRDGVRCTFRILDAALMSRLRMYPELHADIQGVLESLWPPAKNLPNTDWQTLYLAEKGVNFYGWGAASVLTYLQKTDLFPLLWQSSVKNGGPVPAFREGYTDPVCLRFLSEPVIAHGRWALQSAVTVKNAHPFHDVRRHRCIVLNGQFSNSVETETRDYLKQVVGVPFRSENSSEYFSLLWGYYFDNLSSEKKRYDEIRLQIDTGLDDYHMGSHAIDFKEYRRLRDKSAEALDELAFGEAVRRMKSDGGQIAAAGISLYSPRRLYVACHNRPAFVVQRADNNDIMIVSDINAALGLFSQLEIQKNTERLQRLMKQHQKELRHYRNFGASDAETARVICAQIKAENLLLEPFRVTVFPLEGEEIFVCLEAVFKQGKFRRTARIFDFDGNPLTDIEAFSTVLNPLQISKSLYGSFFEAHINQVPERLDYILRTYIPEGQKRPRLALRKRVLERRFGPDLRNLKRMLLIGMGSACNMGRLAVPFIHELMPEMDVRVIRPTEVDNIRHLVFPETDLVLMLSWSSTTADMVEFAKEILSAGAIMIGITEKVFADMALICNKSGGVIPVLSGEEVTVSGIKSTLCMLFCQYLFVLWLAQKRGQPGGTVYADRLKEIPRALSGLLDNPKVKKFSGALAEQNARSHACMIIGDTAGLPVSREAALKLEECSGSAIGRALDFRDILSEPELVKKLAEDDHGHLVIVNAVTPFRMAEALAVIRLLCRKSVRFSVLAMAGTPQESDIRKFSRENCFFLPDTDEIARPFLMLLFYYIFTLDFARAKGRKEDAFPRNRVKSVAAGRSRPRVLKSAGGELMVLARLNSALRSADDSFPLSAESLWEEQAVSDAQKAACRRIRLSGEHLSGRAPLHAFFGGDVTKNENKISEIGRLIFEELKDGGELIFMPFDRKAESAARNIACQWQRFTECAISVQEPNQRKSFSDKDGVRICLAADVPDPEEIRTGIGRCEGRFFWIGPALTRDIARIFQKSLGYFPADLSSDTALYAGICCFFTEAWKSASLQKGNVVGEHFRHAGNYIRVLLNDGNLLKHIRKIMKANRKYHTAFYIGPPAGTGQAWGRRFDRTGIPDMAWHSFGTAAHGPLATVDDRAGAKFIRLEDRETMLADYGREKVMAWERFYLGGLTIDRFLSGEALPADRAIPAPGPFFAEGAWYLPELRQAYDTVEDNLIILDATRSHYFGQALDELSTLGCRHARIILITQQAFVQMPDKRSLFTHPYSHIITLPSPEAEGESIPISGFMLPFLMDIIGTVMSANATIFGCNDIQQAAGSGEGVPE